MALNYSELARIIAQLDAKTTAAECHGVLCGMLSAPSRAYGNEHMAQWLSYTLFDGQVAPANLSECVAELAEFYQKTLGFMNKAMDDGDIAFNLLLPDDEEVLPIRSTALGEWCAGFLVGFGLRGNDKGEKLSEQIQELLKDFSEISKINADAEHDITADDEDEQAYVEVAEYVRIGALFIYESFRPAHAVAPKAPEPQTIH